MSAVAQGDPVVAEYDVFLTDELTERVMLFQYPNRDTAQPLTEANHAKPSGIRIKPNAGMVEVDIPMNLYENFDKDKAIRWGEAIRKSAAERAGGSHGLAGGFGIGASASSGAANPSGSGLGGRNHEADPNVTPEMLLANFATANAQGRVLNKQTLAGQIESVTDEQPVYMVGVFQNSKIPMIDVLSRFRQVLIDPAHTEELHLSRVNSVVQLRPQFHHVDAMTEQDRSSARGLREVVNPPRQQEARAVQMAVKSVDGEDFDMSETMKTLKEIQEEKWKSLDYKDENVRTTEAV